MTTQCISFRDRTRDKEKKVVHKKNPCTTSSQDLMYNGCPRKKYLEFMVKKSITRVLTIWIPWTLNIKWSETVESIQWSKMVFGFLHRKFQKDTFLSDMYFWGPIKPMAIVIHSRCKIPFHSKSFLVLMWEASYLIRIRKPLDIQIETILS